ncbi:NAD-dependent succinate-semialdehyde dehydrogenase [Gordonia sp. NPDC003424]
MNTHPALPNDLPTGLWIDGVSTPAANGRTFEVRDPSTGDVLTQISDAGPDDAKRALESVTKAQTEWGKTSPRQRSDILRNAWQGILDRSDDFADLMTLEMGKTLVESRGEVANGAEFFRWFSEEAVRVQGRYTTAPAGNGRILVSKAPVGPTLAITPWNFPLAMGTRKIGPALAAGCTVISKPAEDTPLTMLLLAQVLADAGLPAGVFSVLPALDAAAVTRPLFDDTRLRKVTFTGSTGVGKLLIEQSAKNVLRTSMELGGNAPFVVFDDADIDLAVDGALASKMRNAGQTCICANRIYVANSIRDEFTTKLTERIAALKVGPADEQGVEIGPLVNEKQRRRVVELVDDAVKAGAQVRTGGAAIDGPGHFFQPTLLEDVPTDARITREEIFGPVAVVVGFDTDDEAVDVANSTEYGLAAYIYTTSVERAFAVSERLESGMVGVNRAMISDVAAPFGGVKQSGLGREGGVEGIEEYLETKYLAFP